MDTQNYRNRVLYEGYNYEIKINLQRFFPALLPEDPTIKWRRKRRRSMIVHSLPFLSHRSGKIPIKDSTETLSLYIYIPMRSYHGYILPCGPNDRYPKTNSKNPVKWSTRVWDQVAGTSYNNGIFEGKLIEKERSELTLILQTRFSRNRHFRVIFSPRSVRCF